MFWGDCSLANTLLMRDGQRLQAYLVDGETSELYEHISDGQRAADIEIAIENVAGDLADMGVMNGKSMEEMDDDFEAALSLRDRYEGLWQLLHSELTVRQPDGRHRVTKRLHDINERPTRTTDIELVRDSPEAGPVGPVIITIAVWSIPSWNSSARLADPATGD
jgi:hypothetical protein